MPDHNYRFLDEAGLERVWSKIKNLLANKVDKVSGKGLSTNDYTNAAKAKVDAIPSNPKYTDTTYSAGAGLSLSGTTFSNANHATSATTYGLGTESNYGHVKIVNNHTTTAHTNGLALSAYQGKVIYDSIPVFQETGLTVDTTNFASGSWCRINRYGKIRILSYYLISNKAFTTWTDYPVVTLSATDKSAITIYNGVWAQTQTKHQALMQVLSTDNRLLLRTMNESYNSGESFRGELIYRVA